MKRRQLCALAASMLAGCAATPAANYYTLSAAASPAGEVLSPQAPSAVCDSIAVGPVWIPEEVDRPQIVIRLAPNRVAIDEFQRWAAPLQASIQRVVVENLALLLGGAAVAPYPDGVLPEAACRLQIQVLRFESTAGAVASIDVLWTLRRMQDATVRNGRMHIDEPAGAAGIDALAAAHSRALATLSRELAEALRLPAPAVRAVRPALP